MIDAVETLEISVVVNGEAVRHKVPVRQHLVDFLRGILGLTGAHLGCEHGVCGACTVRLDGVPVRGCLTLAAQADGAIVETIEGVVASGEVGALLDAFVAHNALQCGFCTPGMVLTAADLLRREDIPTRPEIREHLAGNLCRCTGYQAIVDAVETALQKRPPG